MYHFYDVHGITKFKFFKHHLSINDYTGQLLLISMQFTQLELGKEKPFYNTSYDIYSGRVTPTWVTHLWQYLSNRALDIDLSFNIVLPKQRKNDQFLMDVVEQFFCPTDVVLINKMRIHLQIVFLSDICDIRGRKLLPDLRRKLIHRKSSLNWPKQPWNKSWDKLWTRTCNVLQKYISSPPLGDWKCWHFVCNATLTNDEMFLSLNSDLYCKDRSNPIVYNLIQPLASPSTLNFEKSCDIYISKNRPILISSMTINHNKIK